MTDNRHISTAISFRSGDEETCFAFMQMDDCKDKIYLDITDGSAKDHESVSCSLSLDEAEYVANRLLEWIRFQRETNNE